MQAARGASLRPSDQSRAPATSPSRRRYVLLLAGIAAAAYVVDVVSKVLAVQWLSDRGPVEVVGQFFMLTLAFNKGASFSMGTSHTVVFSLIAIVAAAVVVWVARRVRSTGWAVGLGFLLAGVLGNLTDRVFRGEEVLRGHVVDFLAFPHFPVFNVADVCINIAAAVIIIQALRGVRVDGTRHHDEEPDRGTREP